MAEPQSFIRDHLQPIWAAAGVPERYIVLLCIMGMLVYTENVLLFFAAFRRMRKGGHPISHVVQSLILVDYFVGAVGVFYVLDKFLLKLGESNAVCLSPLIRTISRSFIWLTNMAHAASQLFLLLCCLDRLQGIIRPVEYRSVNGPRRQRAMLGISYVAAFCQTLASINHRIEWKPEGLNSNRAYSFWRSGNETICKQDLGTSIVVSYSLVLLYDVALLVLSITLSYRLRKRAAVHEGRVHRSEKQKHRAEERSRSERATSVLVLVESWIAVAAAVQQLSCVLFFLQDRITYDTLAQLNTLSMLTQICASPVLLTMISRSLRMHWMNLPYWSFLPVKHRFGFIQVVNFGRIVVIPLLIIFFV